MKKTKSETVNRRAFLKAGAAVGGGAAATALLPGLDAAEGEDRTSICDGKATKGYQVSQHVRDYYRTAKV